MVVKKGAAPGPKGKRKTQTFVIDCAKPVEDKIMEIGSFESFLRDKIKVEGKTGMDPAKRELCRMDGIFLGWWGLFSLVVA